MLLESELVSVIFVESCTVVFSLDTFVYLQNQTKTLLIQSGSLSFLQLSMWFSMNNELLQPLVGTECARVLTHCIGETLKKMS